MSSLTGVAAAVNAPPVENWGALKWTTRQSKSQNGQNGAGLNKVKKEDEIEEKNGGGGREVDDVVLQLVSLPKPQHHSSGAPASAVEKPILQIPISHISSASATTKNDLSLALRPKASITNMQEGNKNVLLELSSIRFAIPNVCVGHEQTEEAGREILAEVQEKMKEYQSKLLGESAASAGSEANDKLLLMMAGGNRKDEKIIAVLDDIAFSYPSGRYKLIISNYSLVLEDKKRGTTSAGSGAIASIPLSDVLQLYLCDIPDSGTGEEGDEELAQYVVVILRNPLKIRTTTYNHLVISCPAGFSLDESHPWRSQLETQEEIDQILAALPHNQNSSSVAKTEEGEAKSIKNTFTPTMSGRVSEIIIRVLKAVTGVTALGGFNKEYQTSKGHSVLRCLHHGADGLLFILQSALLFLHRPATRAMISDIKRIEIDESERGGLTFQIVVYGSFGKRGGGSSSNSNNNNNEDKLVFAALDRREKEGLLAYLEKKVTVRRLGVSVEDEDEGEDEEESDESDEEDKMNESDEESDEDDFDFDDEDDESESGDDDRKKRKRRHSKDKKRKHDRKKEKKDKKDKHRHRDKKEKKDKHRHRDKKHKKEEE